MAFFSHLGEPSQVRLGLRDMNFEPPEAHAGTTVDGQEPQGVHIWSVNIWYIWYIYMYTPSLPTNSPYKINHSSVGN